jgi:hypothetical protein
MSARHLVAATAMLEGLMFATVGTTSASAEPAQLHRIFGRRPRPEYVVYTIKEIVGSTPIHQD